MKQAEVFVDINSKSIAVGILIARGAGRSEQTTFSYHSTFLASPLAYPIDPQLPLQTGTMTTSLDQAMFGAFSDVAPDQWGRRVIMRSSQRDLINESVNEIDFVLGVRDDMRQGNLRFKPVGEHTYLAPSEEAFPPVLSLPDLLRAADDLDSNRVSDSDLLALLNAGSSAGGARPKAVVSDDSGNLYIAKFPRTETDEWDVNAWEYAISKLAKQCGINCAESQLLQVANKNVLLVRRFDRTAKIRIGYVSAMTLIEGRLGDPGSYVEIAEAIANNSLRVAVDLEELWRRIAFTIAVSNTDDHLRNHGFLRSEFGNGWDLSPAFDINPEPRLKTPRLSTPIVPGRDEADINLLVSVADTFRLTDAKICEIVEDINQAVSKWQDIATEVGINTVDQRFMSNAFKKLVTN